MNILHHKSWHVRNKDNIERVRRDEAKAAEEEKEKLRKIALAEQEARTDLLRKRARAKRGADEIESTDTKLLRLDDTASTSQSVDLPTTSSSAVSGIYTQSGNINFFQDLESGDVKQGKNAEHEEEKKVEKEKWEKDIGLLTYLGQSAVETQESAPWYLTGRKKGKEPLNPVERDRKLKESLDPLHSMKSYVHKTKHQHEEKDSRHRHKHKKSKKDKSSKKAEKHLSASKTIEQLRAERLKREGQEKQRTFDLLTGGQDQKEKVREEPVNERNRGYNSAFNPDLVRKKHDRHSYEQHSDY